MADGRSAASPGKAQAKQTSLGAFIRHNARYIASVVAVVVLVSVGILAVRAFLPAANPLEDPAQTESPANKFDWSLLDRSNNRYSYVVNGEARSRLGIDVSESQLEIDWDAVAQDGIDFAIVRLGYRGATEGGLYVDENFWRNIDGARNAGLDCGVYFFSQANTVDEALEEADFVLGQLQGVSLEYPVGFDSEVVNLKGAPSPTAGLSRDEMTAIAEAFCTHVKEAGYDVLVYGNAYDLARYKPEDMTDCPLWWAEYGARSPSTTADIDFWQYSNSGLVAGIPTVVDMNLDLRNV